MTTLTDKAAEVTPKRYAYSECVSFAAGLAEGLAKAAEIVTAGYQGLAREERLLLVERATQIMRARDAILSASPAPNEREG